MGIKTKLIGIHPHFRDAIRHTRLSIIAIIGRTPRAPEEYSKLLITTVQRPPNKKQWPQCNHAHIHTQSPPPLPSKRLTNLLTPVHSSLDPSPLPPCKPLPTSNTVTTPSSPPVAM